MGAIFQNEENYMLLAFKILTCHIWEILDFLLGKTSGTAEILKVAYTLMWHGKLGFLIWWHKCDDLRSSEHVENSLTNFEYAQVLVIGNLLLLQI